MGILARLQNFVSDQFRLKLVSPLAEICARPMCEGCCCKHRNAEPQPFRYSHPPENPGIEVRNAEPLS